MGWLLYLSLISFALMAMPLGALAQHPMGQANNTLVCSPGGPCPVNMLAEERSSNDAADINIESWWGIATKGTESHPIRMNIESIRPINPAEARRLLETNASLNEIRLNLEVRGNAPIKAGNMKLDNNIYRLINITVVTSGNKSILDANIVGPIAGPRSSPNKSNTNVGHITITISSANNTESTEGTLAISDPEYSGTYRLLLERQIPGRGPRAGLMA